MHCCDVILYVRLTNLTYGNEVSRMSEYTGRLRDLVREESKRLIGERKPEGEISETGTPE